jgi:hypothetical protein
LSISEPQVGPQAISNALLAIISCVIAGFAAWAARGIAEWRTAVETTAG